MIMLNDEWENPKEIDDISKIIRDGFSSDLADLLDEIASDMVSDYNSELINKQDEIDYMDTMLDDFETMVDSLEEQITDLERERDELLDQLNGEVD